MSETRILHCWKDEREYAEETYGFGSPEWADTYLDPITHELSDRSGTCMLPAGHEGPHVFTPDDQIGVTFTKPQTRKGGK